MQYDDRVPFDGDREAVIERAARTLMALNYRITRQEPEVLEAFGPGYRSTKQNPLLGATFIRVSFLDPEAELEPGPDAASDDSRGDGTWAESGEVRLEADLGGARFMHRFVFFFPLVLCLGLYALFSILSKGNFRGPITLTVFGPLIVWLFVAPLLARRIIVGTVRALETFLFNITGFDPDQADRTEDGPASPDHLPDNR